MTCHSLLPMRGKGKSLSECVRLGRANRPHAKEVLYGALSLTVHGRRGKSLRVWVRLLHKGPIDHTPKEVHIMQLCLSSDLSMTVCLGGISIFVASCHVALGEVSGFEILLDSFLAHSEYYIVS